MKDRKKKTYKLGCLPYSPSPSIKDDILLNYKKIMYKNKIPFDISKKIHMFLSYCHYASEGGCDTPFGFQVCGISSRTCTGFSTIGNICDECNRRENLWLQCCRLGNKSWCNEEPDCPHCQSCTMHCECIE